MPKQVALLCFIAFILWLLARAQKTRPMLSKGLWVPLIWLLIIGSRPLSLWFQGGIMVETPQDYLEGSPVDRNIFLLLIIAGLVVLAGRAVSTGQLISANAWLCAFLFYCCVSCTWSDYPFVALKRWFKDIGNVVMVLIILTERDPVQAARAVLSRFAFVVIPLSVLFIKYYPEFGRYYSQWTWQPFYSGVTTEKNALGCLTFLCGIFLVWDWLYRRTQEPPSRDRAQLYIDVLLVLMIFWLIDKADSSNALICLWLGAALLFLLRWKRMQPKLRRLGTYGGVAFGLAFVLFSIPGLFEAILELLGEDATLTGRTDLWAELMKEKLNPLLGTGYQTFWLGPRAEYYWEKWSFHPNQAHNGYLETYLGGGLIGLGLLIVTILSTGRALRDELLRGSEFARLRFTFFVVTLLYNWSEAMFNKLSPIWLLFLLGIVRAKPLGQHLSSSPQAVPESRFATQ